ncbi:MAG: alkaline phosphatase, partial [Frankiales bacterium]|nr:alkaline phosphatase [Frankiales bacterium]
MKRSLTCLGVSALALSVVAGVVVAPAAQAQTRQSEAKNIILFIGDGMGRTHVTAGRQRFYGAAGRLNMETLPVVGQVSTYAVEESSTQPSLVTDSASSGTAWSSGVKTYNAALGVDAFGKKVPTLMEQAKTAGMRTGNVSTAEITDATPAAMMSHVLLRGCQGPKYSDASCKPAAPTSSDPSVLVPVAEQIARNGTADVIFGGGLSRFEPDDQKALTDQGYSVLGSFGDATATTQTAATQRVATRGDLAGTSAPKVIGLFNRGNLTVETSKAAAAETAPQKQEPSVGEMTQKAIDLLKGGDKGFLLQVEGALIDKRSHANDATQTLGEIKAFDDAVKIAIDYAKTDPSTLVIVTADHECAGFNIIEKGTFTNAEAAAPPTNVDGGNTANNSTPSRASGNTRDTTRSNGIVNGTSDRPSPSASATPTTGLYGSADPKNFAPATFRTADDPVGVTDGSPQASLWLSYLSGNHTGADVPIFAVGPESQRFLGTQDNTDLYRDMFGALRALGNQNTSTPPPAPQASPVAFRAIVQGRG